MAIAAKEFKLAFIGLGVMGFPMAGHLVAKGHQVTVYNRTFSKAEAWVAKHGGAAAVTPAAAASGAEIVFACVGNDDDLAQVIMGRQGAFTTLPTFAERDRIALIGVNGNRLADSGTIGPCAERL